MCIIFNLPIGYMWPIKSNFLNLLNSLISVLCPWSKSIIMLSRLLMIERVSLIVKVALISLCLFNHFNLIISIHINNIKMKKITRPTPATAIGISSQKYRVVLVLSKVQFHPSRNFITLANFESTSILSHFSFFTVGSLTPVSSQSGPRSIRIGCCTILSFSTLFAGILFAGNPRLWRIHSSKSTS